MFFFFCCYYSQYIIFSFSFSLLVLLFFYWFILCHNISFSLSHPTPPPLSISFPFYPFFTDSFLNLWFAALVEPNVEFILFSSLSAVLTGRKLKVFACNGFLRASNISFLSMERIHFEGAIRKTGFPFGCRLWFDWMSFVSKPFSILIGFNVQAQRVNSLLYDIYKD